MSSNLNRNDDARENAILASALHSNEQWIVRRLMPVECERLQGFADNYTLVPFRGKPAPASRRYQALGNSMAINVMRWIATRIVMVGRLTAENERRHRPIR